MLSEVAVKVCYTDTLVLPEEICEFFDHDGREDRLPGSGDTWTEQRLLADFHPPLEFW